MSVWLQTSPKLPPKPQPSCFSSLRRAEWACIGLTVLVALILAPGDHHSVAQESAHPIGPRTISSLSSTAPESRTRIREGTIFTDVVGQFRMVGNRLTFAENGKKSELRCLENLSLERVTRVTSLQGDAGNLTWTVTGTITEYHGKNFLLVSRAVMNAEPSRQRTSG